MKLSVLKNATEGCITYYTGYEMNHVSHLKNCKLYCNKDFSPDLENVEIVNVADPQLEFYKLSEEFKEDYLESEMMINKNGYWIHKEAEIGEGTTILPGCVIGKCVIGKSVTINPNCVIFSKTKIEDDTVIDSNCSIGSSGMMWVWAGNEKVFLEQLGDVKIGKGCKIGANSCVVRGSANESTIIEEYVCLAPGCMIGHGTVIKRNTHLANNVSTGGSSHISSNNFIGSGSTISPGSKILVENVILGAGGVVVDIISEPGVYAGVPAKKIKNVEKKMKGVPNWIKD
jgi:UDP-3-O-[3-hydroxymyristoyl] glucosamine N-acyltransferase